MRKKLIFACCLLIMPCVVYAEDTTTTQTCANGAGLVLPSTISGHEYCMSNNTMNWWNAVAWCDALGRRLFSMDDCGCDWNKNCNGICPETKGVVHTDVFGKWIWTATPKRSTGAYNSSLGGGTLDNWPDRSFNGYRAFCY